MPFSDKIKKTLSNLYTADPEIAEFVYFKLIQKNIELDKYRSELLIKDTIWGLSVEESFGRAVACGHIDLTDSDMKDVEIYRELVFKAAKTGPSFGKIMALNLIPVLKADEQDFLEKFLNTVSIMTKVGAFTLKPAFFTLSSILKEKDIKSAYSFLDLLTSTYQHKLTYNKYQYFSKYMTKQVLDLDPLSRNFQIKQINNVMLTNHLIVDSFLEGFFSGLNALSKQSLDFFVLQGISLIKKSNVKSASRFLGLKSKTSKTLYNKLRINVSFFSVKQQLDRYLKARTGKMIVTNSWSNLPDKVKQAVDKDSLVCSYANFIYLKEKIGVYDSREKNIDLYKYLIKLETGLKEFNTFDFDIEKFFDKLKNSLILKQKTVFKQEHRGNTLDIKLFFELFSKTDLTQNLFTIFEHGRIRILYKKLYPGINKSVYPVLFDNAQTLYNNKTYANHLLSALYTFIAIGCTAFEDFIFSESVKTYTQSLIEDFDNCFSDKSQVEDTALFIFKHFKNIEEFIKSNSAKNGNLQTPVFKTPFNRKISETLFSYSDCKTESVLQKINADLAKKNLKAYRSDIKQILRKNNNKINAADLKEIIIYNTSCGMQQNCEISLDILSDIIHEIKDMFAQSGERDLEGFRYKEWDFFENDYINDHVLVREKTVHEICGDFYTTSLHRHKGVVKKIRYAFELLKPQQFSILRKWREGDEFDYESLINFAIDKKAGIMPSDKLYIKRLKNIRDVAVLILIDLSRSTANFVLKSDKTVLDTEKEAVVLLSEALEVVGDQYCIAGFSGTGRLGVDYFIVKDFNEQMNNKVKMRINGIAPQRSTRMGAAIRHSAYRLGMVSAKIRLMLIIGDGFPNDTNYKQDYAIEDTRKAILESRSKNIFTHGVIVNMAENPKLNNLFGNAHHHVISDITNLHDKLFKIYNFLTR